MLNIGDQVTFIRADEKGAIIQGEGRIRAFFVQDGRILAQVRTASGVFNVWQACVNPSPEFCAAFERVIVGVQELSDEGNAAARAVVADYNARVDALYSTVLGPLFEEVESHENAKPEAASSQDL